MLLDDVNCIANCIMPISTSGVQDGCHGVLLSANTNQSIKFVLLCRGLTQGFAKQLAQLFGINAASQGGGSSGRTCLMLQLTADTTTALDGAALQRLQVLLRGELAKEMSSGLIARDDTLASLKQDKKQRRR